MAQGSESDNESPKDVLILSKEPQICRPDDDDSHGELTGKSVLKEKTAQGGGKILWRVANGLMSVFFVMAVGVQFNDPDPYLWVPLYGIAALLTVCVTIQPSFTGQKWWKCLYWSHTAFCVGMFCYVFVELIIAVTKPKSEGSLNPLTHEEGREMAGIMITVVWLFTCKQSPTIRSKSKFMSETAIGLLVIALSLLPLALWALCYSDVMSPSYFSLCGDFFLDEFSF